jgi:hypothetical protein
MARTACSVPHGREAYSYTLVDHIELLFILSARLLRKEFIRVIIMRLIHISSGNIYNETNGIEWDHHGIYGVVR